MWQAREAYLKRQEQKRLELKAKEEEEQRLKEKEWQRQIDDCKQNFLNGERITANVFLEIAKRDGFEIHNPYTKGIFNKSVNGLTKSGTIYFRKYKGKRTPDFTGCQRAIADYLNFLASSNLENEYRKSVKQHYEGKAKTKNDYSEKLHIVTMTSKRSHQTQF